MAGKPIPLSFGEELPSPVLFGIARLDGPTSYPTQSHNWGEFVYSFSGVIELAIGNRQYLAPPHYGIWLPPQAEHFASTRSEALYCLVRIAPDRCERMPREACTLAVGPLIRAILSELMDRRVECPDTPEDERLMLVLVDQLIRAPQHRSYLPTSDDPALGRVLQALREQPSDNRSLAEWATQVHSTERTLSRRCQRDLGMSFAEWRQRLRLVRALAMLEEGAAVQSVALELGYSTASAFIAMFHRMMGMTPEELRKQVRAG